MNSTRSVRRLTAVLAFVATAGLSLAAAPVPAARAQGGGGTSGGGKTAPATLQADWPAAVPVPAGTVTGTNGVAPSEVVALLVNMGYSDVVVSVTALYTSHGFVQASNGTMTFSTPKYRVTVVGSSHDHSATQTDVVVGLQTL